MSEVEREMSDVIEWSERFYKACTKMFTRAICRIVDDPRVEWKQKLLYMKRIDRYIDKASKVKYRGEKK